MSHWLKWSSVFLLTGAIASVAGCGSDDTGSEPTPSNEGGVGGADGSTDPYCGDGQCGADEDCKSCASDCGRCDQPSCEDGKMCGDLSCCATSDVPAGIFDRGRSLGGDDACPCDTTCSDNDRTEHEVQVGDFTLEVLEVSVGRFRAFVEAYDGPPAPGVGAHPRVADSGWKEEWHMYVPSEASEFSERLACDPDFQTWTDTPGGNEDKPINCVNWYEAFAFCACDEGRLPTESEWEYAAAGGSLNRLYPWGQDAPEINLAVYDCLVGTTECSKDDVQPVGSRLQGKGRWGHRDLAGNLYEWTLDVFSMEAYANPSTETCEECTYLGEGDQRVIRGGSFAHTATTLRASARDDAFPSERRNAVGFRCVRSD